MLAWIKANGAAFWWISIASLVALGGAAILVPLLVVRLPADYFAKPHRPDAKWMRWPLLRIPFLVVKNVLGYTFIVAGIIMLVIPGQGILTILIGSSLADYPGKFRLHRWLLTRKGVLETLNWLRKRAGKGPLVV